MVAMAVIVVAVTVIRVSVVGVDDCAHIGSFICDVL